MPGVWVHCRKPCESVMATLAAVTNRPWHFSGITQQKLTVHLSLCCWSTGGRQWCWDLGSIRLRLCSDLEGPTGLPWGRREEAHPLLTSCSHFISKSYPYSRAWKYSPWLHTELAPLLASIPSQGRGVTFSGGCCLCHPTLARRPCDHPKLPAAPPCLRAAPGQVRGACQLPRGVERHSINMY